MAVELGGTYAEQGASVSDNNPAYAATEATVGGDAVDTSAAGTYTVTYTAPADGSGNLPYAVERTVTVRDTTKPVISLNGDRGVTVALNGTYAEQGATVSDNDPAYPATEATVGGDAVDTGTAGTYTVTYTAPADGAGNEPDPAFRTVSVRDPDAPEPRAQRSAAGGFKTTNVLASHAISYDVCDPSREGAVMVLAFSRPGIDMGLNVYAADSVSFGVDVTESVPASDYVTGTSLDLVYTVWTADVRQGAGKFFVTVFDRDDARTASAVLVDTTATGSLGCSGSILPHEPKDPDAEILPLGPVEQSSE